MVTDGLENGRLKYRWYFVLLLSAQALLSSAAASLPAPALPEIATDLSISSDVERQLVFSVYSLGFLVGSFVLEPCSEYFGHYWTLLATLVISGAFNTGSGFANSKLELLLFRWVSGFGGAGPIVIGPLMIRAVLARKRQAGALVVWNAASGFGLGLGPLLCAWITERTSWRWSFWAIAACNGLAIVLTSVLIALKVVVFALSAALPMAMSFAVIWKSIYPTINLTIDYYEQTFQAKDGDRKRLLAKLKRHILTMIAIFFHHPSLLPIAACSSLAAGTLNFVLSSLSQMAREQYGQSLGISGLVYLALGVLLLVALPVTTVLHMGWKKRQERGVERQPDKKHARSIRFLAPALIYFSGGLALYGWTAEKRLSFAGPVIGLTLVSSGVAGISTFARICLVELFDGAEKQRILSSGLAGLSALGYLSSFGFPLFAPAFIGHLGYGWSSTILGLSTLVTGALACLVVMLMIRRLKRRST
jgi:MFS family permease